MFSSPVKAKARATVAAAAAAGCTTCRRSRFSRRIFWISLFQWPWNVAFSTGWNFIYAHFTSREEKQILFRRIVSLIVTASRAMRADNSKPVSYSLAIAGRWRVDTTHHYVVTKRWRMRRHSLENGKMNKLNRYCVHIHSLETASWWV